MTANVNKNGNSHLKPCLDSKPEIFNLLRSLAIFLMLYAQYLFNSWG